MGSTLFKQFIKKFVLDKQPGPPPRPGLTWKPTTHRWIRDPSHIEGWTGEPSPSPTTEDFKEDYSVDPVDFDINEHKKIIHSYVKTVMDDYLIDNDEDIYYLTPKEIKDEIFHQVLEGQRSELGYNLLDDLDIVVPQDEAALDVAMESIMDTITDSVEHHWKMGRGL